MTETFNPCRNCPWADNEQPGFCDPEICFSEKDFQQSGGFTTRTPIPLEDSSN